MTRDEIVQRLALDEARVFVSSFDRPNIRYRIVEKDNARAQLLDFIREDTNMRHDDAGIVYCLSRKQGRGNRRVAEQRTACARCRITRAWTFETRRNIRRRSCARKAS